MLNNVRLLACTSVRMYPCRVLSRRTTYPFPSQCKNAINEPYNESYVQTYEMFLCMCGMLNNKPLQRSISAQ